MKNPANKKRVIISAIIILLAAGIIGFVLLATPYGSRLARKVDQWLHERQIPYTHNNIYTDGVQGILDDIRTEIDLPETLYIDSVQTIDYAVDGTVTEIYMSLYGTTEKGKTHGWEISYNASQDEDEATPTLTVYVERTLPDYTLQNGFTDDVLLAPMITLAETMDLAECSRSYASSHGCERLEIIYCGYRSMEITSSSYIVSENGTLFLAEDYGMVAGTLRDTCEGYEISLHSPDGGPEPDRYYANWLTSADHVAPMDELDVQRTDEALQGSGYLDSNDGSMYCYVSDEIGYHLFVADAAAGSRFYQLEKTTDGGTTWTMQNEDPFLGIIGVVGGMQFEDELHGRIWLDSPSGGTKEICETADGGVTFTAVEETAADSE